MDFFKKNWVWGLGFGVLDFEFGVWGVGCEVWGLGFGVWGSECEVWGLGLGFWVWSLGFEVGV